MVMENILFLIKTSEVVIHKGNEQENELLKIKPTMGCNAIHPENMVKRRRAQGGCLGTKSR